MKFLFKYITGVLKFCCSCLELHMRKAVCCVAVRVECFSCAEVWKIPSCICTTQPAFLQKSPRSDRTRLVTVSMSCGKLWTIIYRENLLLSWVLALPCRTVNGSPCVREQQPTRWRIIGEGKRAGTRAWV